MKHILPILLVLALLLTACASSAQPADTQSASQVPTEAPSPSSAPVRTDAPAPESTVPASTRREEPTTQPPTQTPAPLFPQTLLDNEFCSVTVMDAGMSEIWGFSVNLRCENKTDHAQLYTLPAAACRGWQLNTDWLATVNAGETKDSELHVFPADLARCGLEDVDECRLHLELQDYDSFSNEVLADEWLVFYPTGMSPEKIAPAPTRTPQAGDVVLLDDECVSFTLCGTEPDTIWPYHVIVSYENKTDRDFSFTLQDVTVNGIDANLWLDQVMPAGLKGCRPVYFDEETMKNNGVERVKQVDGTLVIRDSVTMETYFTQDFSYAPAGE